jgi:DNA-binding NarL/FixJ family response regulator
LEAQPLVSALLLDPVMGDSPAFLIVDDQPEVRNFTRRVLASAFPGAVITNVGERREFEAILRSREWNVVIASFGLEWGTAFDVIRLVHASISPCPVIVLSGFITPEMERAVPEAGAYTLLPKQALHGEEFVAVVRRALERPQHFENESSGT